MYTQQVSLLILLLMILDGIAVIVSGYSSFHLVLFLSSRPVVMEDYVLVGMIMFVMFGLNFFMGLTGLYSDRHFASLLPLFKRLAASLIMVFSILAVALYSLKIYHVPRLYLGAFALLTMAGIILNRVILELVQDRLLAHGLHSRRILIIGSGPRAQALSAALSRQKSWGHKIIGCLAPEQPASELNTTGLPCLGSLEHLPRVLARHSVDEVIFALEPQYSRDIKKHLALCDNMGISYLIIPALYNPLAPFRLSVEHIQDIPALCRENTCINAVGLIYKRIMDFIFGLLGFSIFLLIYPLVGIMIKLDSPGPVLFTQPRVGRNGRIFRIYKFRSMYMDAEQKKAELEAGNEMKGLMFKMENDPRITRAGRLLRKTSLDEFPQFINVIKGEMSLVGTRPPTLDEVRHYKAWQRRRISMKPGITGLWQVSGRNRINDFDEVVRLDLEYIDKWKLINDLKIILLTIWVVMKRKGAA